MALTSRVLGKPAEYWMMLIITLFAPPTFQDRAIGGHRCITYALGQAMLDAAGSSGNPLAIGCDRPEQPGAIGH